MHVFIQGDIHVSTFTRLSIVSPVCVSTHGCVWCLCKCMCFSCFHQDCYSLYHISLIVLVILAILGQDIKILSCNVLFMLVFHVQTLLKQIFFRYHPMLWRSNYEACTTQIPLRMLRIKVLQQVEKKKRAALIIYDHSYKLTCQRQTVLFFYSVSVYKSVYTTILALS
jgi:hypothetical protein